MSCVPQVADFPRIRSARAFYAACAYITGIMLVLVVVEVVAKYWGGIELELGGSRGLLSFVPVGSVTAINVSTGILIAHGWFFVLYLFSDFRLWRLMRWPFTTFALIACGGVVPFLSFIVEARVSSRVREVLDSAFPQPRDLEEARY